MVSLEVKGDIFVSSPSFVLLACSYLDDLQNTTTPVPVLATNNLYMISATVSL